MSHLTLHFGSACQPASTVRRETEQLQSPDAVLTAKLRDGLSALFDETDHGSTIPCRQPIGICCFAAMRVLNFSPPNPARYYLRLPKDVHHFEK